MAQPAIPPHSEPTVVLLHDVRAIHDTASLALLAFTVANGGFVVARVRPAQGSGATTVPGAHINADTGEFVSPQGAAAATVKQGAWQAAAASPELPREGRYSWTEPLSQLGRNIAPEDVYSPFVRGGTIAFTPQGKEPDASFFQNTQLLFDDWANEFEPAVKSAEEHPAWFGEETKPDQIAGFMSLAGSANRFMATHAFGKLVQAGRMTAQSAEPFLARADMNLGATLVYLLLSGGVDVAPLTAVARDPQSLRAKAVGAHAAKVFHAQNQQISGRANALIAAVRQQLPQGAGDGVLRLIFQEVPQVR